MEQLKRNIHSRILCVFNGGSNAYGFKGADSDVDYMVIVDDDFDFRLVRYEKEGIKHEAFVLGKRAFREVQEISDDSNTFICSHADNIISCLNKENIIFLEDEYEEEFLELVDKRWDKPKIKKFLLRFAGYYELTLNVGVNLKKYYHIYRIRAMLDYYQNTGSFLLEYPEPYGELAKKYKEHYQALPYANEEVKDLIKFIKEFAENLEES